MSHSTHSFWKVWTVPCVLALIILVGLISALLGVHIAWKVISWIALALPLTIILRFTGRRPRR